MSNGHILEDDRLITLEWYWIACDLQLSELVCVCMCSICACVLHDTVAPYICIPRILCERAMAGLKFHPCIDGRGP